MARKGRQRTKRKSLALELKIWWRPRKHAIHVHVANAGMTTVSRKRGSARYHKHLFNRLASCLRDAGRPAPKLL
jgi:hypothetical protein